MPTLARSSRVCVLLLAAGFALGGCAGNTKVGDTPAPPPQGGANARPDAADAWRPRPVSLRIYPSTRFVKEEDKAILETRIELFDQMGDSIKGSGHVRCELFAAGNGPDTVIGRRLYRWDIELMTLEDHRKFYDPIIRGYVFRLSIDDVEVARHPTLLRVVFQPANPNADRMETEALVSSDW